MSYFVPVNSSKITVKTQAKVCVFRRSQETSSQHSVGRPLHVGRTGQWVDEYVESELPGDAESAGGLVIEGSRTRETGRLSKSFERRVWMVWIFLVSFDEQYFFFRAEKVGWSGWRHASDICYLMILPKSSAAIFFSLAGEKSQWESGWQSQQSRWVLRSFRSFRRAMRATGQKHWADASRVGGLWHQNLIRRIHTKYVISQPMNGKNRGFRWSTKMDGVDPSLVRKLVVLPVPSGGALLVWANLVWGVCPGDLDISLLGLLFILDLLVGRQAGRYVGRYAGGQEGGWAGGWV